MAHENNKTASPLTNSGDHRAHEVEGSREVPARPQRVHPDPSAVRLLILTQQGVQGAQVDPVPLCEVVQLLLPEAAGTQLEGVFQGWEDGRPAQQVEQDECGQQAETGVVFVHGRPGAAAAPSSPPLSHEHSDSNNMHRLHQCLQITRSQYVLHAAANTYMHRLFEALVVQMTSNTFGSLI